MVNFMEAISMRGVMTMLGVRLTTGSCDGILPEKDELYKSFNAIFKVFEINYLERR